MKFTFITLTAIVLVLLLLAISTTTVFADDTAAASVVGKSSAKSSSGTADNKGKSASSTSSKSKKYSSAWLPEWLPNIHRMNRVACDSINDFRKNSPIVKKLVEEHAGKIEAVNRDEGGAVIKIQLPVNETARGQMIAKLPGRAEIRRERA